MKSAATSTPVCSTTRRQFLHTTLGASAALLAAPAFIGATDKAGSKNAIVGSEEYQYECQHDWGLDTLPAGAHYGNASHGVATDSQGLIYITHYGQPGSIFVFDAKGKFVRALGDFHTQSKSGKGHGIDIRKEGGAEFISFIPMTSASTRMVTYSLRSGWRPAE